MEKYLVIDINLQRKTIIKFMNITTQKIIIYICLTSLFVFLSCTPTQTKIYEQCKEQVETINRMHLYATYLVPVDSLGQYMNDEVISEDMYHHCEVVANVNPNQAHALAILYFDKAGKVRKSIEWWSDGGDLRNVSYYNNQGNVIYAIYNYYDNNCGKLYINDSKHYIEYPFSQPDNKHKNIFPALNINELVSEYKVHLQMPINCNTVSFKSIQEGDKAFLCTENIYATPKGTNIKNENASVTWFGKLIRIDSIANDWCRVTELLGNPIGYVQVDSIELFQRD